MARALNACFIPKKESGIMTKPPDSDFEAFERKRVPRSLGEDEASLSATNILLSEPLYLRLPRVERVVLMFNAAKREIGIRPVKGKERGYKLAAAFHRCCSALFSALPNGGVFRHVSRTGHS